MSHPDPKPFLIPAVLAICAVCGPSRALSAQEAGSAAQPPRHQTVSLQFGGGSLADFAAAVRKAGTNINIVVPALAKKVPIPELTLTDAAVDAALSAAGSVTTADYMVHVERLAGPTGQPVYAVTVADREALQARNNTSTGPSPAPDVVRVFSLKVLTDPIPGEPMGIGTTIDAKTILTAIETGLEISGSEQKTAIRYHADSGLLFVHGTRDQAEMVREVLTNLTGDIEQRRNAVRRAAAEEARRVGPTQTGSSPGQKRTDR